MSDVNHEIEVLWLAENEYLPGASLKIHSHQEYYQIYYVVEGEGIFSVDGTNYPIKGNMLALLCPGVPHGIPSVGGEQHPGMRMLEAKFAVLSSRLDYELHRVPGVSQGLETLKALLNQTFLEGVQKDLYYDEIVTHLLCTMLYRIIRLHKNYNQDLALESLQPRVTKQVREYLNLHFAEDISLDALGEVVGYSKTYLCRIFREDTGITINNYLNNVRISKAVELLANTDMELAEIGKAAGYNNVYHFIKTFKKVVGVPPGSYRRGELIGSDLVCEQVQGISTLVRADITVWNETNDDDKAP